MTFYEPDAYDRQQHRDIPDPEWATVVVYPANEAGVATVLRQAGSADVLVKASGVGVFDELLDRAVLDVRRPGATTIFWDVDAPATLDRLRYDPADPFHALVSRYDMVFTYGAATLSSKAIVPPAHVSACPFTTRSIPRPISLPPRICGVRPTWASSAIVCRIAKRASSSSS